MNLYLYPQAANNQNGYGIAILDAYMRDTPRNGDVVVWYSSYDVSQMQYLRDEDIIIKRKGPFSCTSISNLIRGRVRSELTVKDLSFLKGLEFDKIHCDDVIFYRAIRKLFPEKVISVRFHNCYSRIWSRNLFLGRNIGLKYRYLLKHMIPLEKQIFQDKCVHKIFLTKEDCSFYRNTFGTFSDSEVWPIIPESSTVGVTSSTPRLRHKLIWFGGVDSHKESSINWFQKEVFPILLDWDSSLEFHLWGGGTEAFDNPSAHIYGHGTFYGDGVPLENCLYLNPDIIGGGVKVKLMTYMKWKVPFISTPFGFEGYDKKIIDNVYCNVVEEDKWADAIIALLKRYGD